MTEKNRTPDLAAVATIEAVSPADEPLDAQKRYTVSVRVLETIRGVAHETTMQCEYRVESRRRSLPLGEPLVAAISKDKSGCRLEGIWRLAQRGMFQ